MSALLLSVAAFVSTMIGGIVALRIRRGLRYLLGFTAGVLLGVVGFELLPEIFRLAQREATDASGAMIALVAGFLVFHGLEKFVLIHRERESHYTDHSHPELGVIAAAALIGHSVIDGVAIGLAFQVSPNIGVAVAVAVVTHDFSDGANTVALMLSHRNTAIRSASMLFLDALAPVVGVTTTWLFAIPASLLMIYLGFFAGFLLYLAVSDILPEAHSRASPRMSVRIMALTAIGAAFTLVVSRFAT